MNNRNIKFGEGDATFNAAGGLSGIKSLVNEFYQVMDTFPEAQHIRNMYPKDISISNDKLYCFLVGWMGGSQLYAEKYGSISIPQVHQHLNIGENERDMWMNCMKQALDKQAYSSELKIYLYEQLSFPAQMIYQVCNK